MGTSNNLPVKQQTTDINTPNKQIYKPSFRRPGKVLVVTSNFRLYVSIHECKTLIQASHVINDLFCSSHRTELNIIKSIRGFTSTHIHVYSVYLTIHYNKLIQAEASPMCIMYYEIRLENCVNNFGNLTSDQLG